MFFLYLLSRRYPIFLSCYLLHCFKHLITANVISGGRLRHSYLLRLAMDVWLGRTHLTLVISTRLECFLQRKERRLKSIVLFKWWHRIVKTKRERTLRMMLLTKVERRCKEWAFQVVKKKVLQKTLVEAHCVQRSNKTRYENRYNEHATIKH